MDDGLERALDRLDREVDRVFGLNGSPAYRGRHSYSSKVGLATEYSPTYKGDSFAYSPMWSPSGIAEPATPSPTQPNRSWESKWESRSSYHPLSSDSPANFRPSSISPVKFNLCQSGGTCCGGVCGARTSSKTSGLSPPKLSPAGNSTTSYFVSEKQMEDDIGALRGKFVTPGNVYEYTERTEYRRKNHWDNSFSDLDSYLRKQRQRLERMSGTLTGLESFVHRGFADPKYL
mmetsp:Transcript_23240/g.58361  ORF Transcript_23240/g.58361 Transcript_23240/m.58361 type:complete len:232 (+) Transcript_23240:217-912(+)